MAASARTRQRCRSPGQASEGWRRPACRSDRARWPTGISASPQPCWDPTFRSVRPDSTRRAPATIEFPRCAQALAPSAAAGGENGATSCSISFSSTKLKRNVRLISSRRNWKSSSTRQNRPAEAGGNARRGEKYEWSPGRDAWGECCAWGATDESCACAQPADWLAGWRKASEWLAQPIEAHKARAPKT